MRNRENTPTRITLELRTSIRTAHGPKFPITAKCGNRTMWARTGLRIAMDGGCTSLTGDGRGYRPIPGGGLRTTTAVGWGLTVVGDGGLARSMEIRSTVRSGPRLMFRSSATVVALELGLVSATVAGDRSDGCLWDRVITSIRGTDSMAHAMEFPASTGSTGVALLRCTAAI